MLFYFFGGAFCVLRSFVIPGFIALKKSTKRGWDNDLLGNKREDQSSSPEPT